MPQLQPGQLDWAEAAAAVEDTGTREGAGGGSTTVHSDVLQKTTAVKLK